MDQMLARLVFPKCYIDGIIVFNSTSKYHMHHLQEVLEKLKDHNLKFYITCIIYKRYSKDLKITTLSFIQASANFSKHMWNI